MAIDAVSVKDKILNQLNNVDEDPMTYAKTAEVIITCLTITDGLWNELHYSYKAKEICDKISGDVSRFLTLTSHSGIVNRLTTILVEARRLSDKFHKLQAESFCDAMGVNDELTREIMKMTNTELAS